MPAFTAVPTASAVCAVGARPVPVDVDERTAALDPAAVAAAVTPATAAIVVVHLYGRPADVEPLLALGVPVIEDAAQAHGALRRITGAAAVYSFYPTKNVGGIGDGGAVVTPDADLATTVRRLRAHGMIEQYVHIEISQNHRMSELEAAWLRLQLPAPGRRQPAAGGDRRGATARPRPTLRWHADHPDHVVHQCVLRAADRDAVRAALAARGVATGVHYPLAITQQPAYRHLAAARLPARRGMGGRVRVAAVLPRADRRRGRHRRRRAGAPRPVTPRNPEVGAISAFFPCYNDELAIPTMVHDVRRALVEASTTSRSSSSTTARRTARWPCSEALTAEVPELRLVDPPGEPRLRRRPAQRVRRGDAGVGLLHRRRRPVRRLRGRALHRRRAARRRHRAGLQARPRRPVVPHA